MQTILIAVAFVALAALAGFVIYLLEQGRLKLIDAVLAKSAREYALIQAHREKKLTPPQLSVHPLIDDEFESFLASRRKKREQEWLEEEMSE